MASTPHMHLDGRVGVATAELLGDRGDLVGQRGIALAVTTAVTTTVTTAATVAMIDTLGAHVRSHLRNRVLCHLTTMGLRGMNVTTAKGTSRGRLAR